MHSSRPYSETIDLCNRWSKCVDFGSPMTAWYPCMWEIDSFYAGDKNHAIKALGVHKARCNQEGVDWRFSKFIPNEY